MKAIFSLIVFTLFLFPSAAFAAWPYTQNFDALSTADLNGQDSWSGDAASDVQTTFIIQGAKTVEVGSTTETGMTRTVTSSTDGTVQLRMRKNSSTTERQHTYFFEGVTLVTGVNLYDTGNILLNGTAIQAYSANTTYLLEIEYDVSTDQSRIRIDGGSWSSWVNFYATATAIDKIEFGKSNVGVTRAAGYWDDIAPVVCDPGTTTCTDVFDTSGYHSWTAPPDVYTALAACWGGGGAGFDGGTGGGGEGGGGGAFASSSVAVTPGTLYTIFVGAGGTVSNTAGATSTFATTTVVADGGGGGGAVVSSKGLGGLISLSTGDVEFAGGDGGNGIDDSTHDGGGGGGGAAGPHGAGEAGADAIGGATDTGGAGGRGDNTSGGTAGAAGNGGAGGVGGTSSLGGGGGGGGDNGQTGGAGGPAGAGGGGGEAGEGDGATGRCEVTYTEGAVEPAATTKRISIPPGGGKFIIPPGGGRIIVQ